MVGGLASDLKKLAHRLAKVILASVFGGPLGGLSEVGTQVVDALLGESNASAKTIDDLISRVGASLEQFAASENIPPDAYERALLNASLVMSSYAPTSAELVALNLDASRVLREVERRGEPILRTLDGDDRSLCTQVLSHTIEALISAPTLLPDLQQQFQQAVLTRLSDLISTSEDPTKALRGATKLAAFAMIADATWPWVREQYPPSALLRANYAVVPFYGRQETLDSMDAWLTDESQVDLVVVTGPGGMGKTRLMLQTCQRARSSGWRAGLLHSSVAEVTAGHLDAVGDGARGVLVVVDYAETRLATTRSLVEAALASTSRVRIVLVARSLGDWWTNLRYQQGRIGDFLNGPRTTRFEITPVADHPDERGETYQAAAKAFAAALGLTLENVDVPDLESPLYDRVLFVHLSALSDVLGEPSRTQRDLLDFALRREQGFLDNSVQAAGLPHLAGRPINQAAALVTLTGGVESFRAAVELLSQVPQLYVEPPAVLGRVAQLLHDLYPATTWLTGVQPDLLGEHLVSRAIDDDPLLLGALHGVG